MVKVLVLYYSRTGNTQQMAQAVAEGARIAGATVTVQDITSCEPKIMLNYDGIIVGSPTYYGLLAGPVKDFIDSSVKYHGKLEAKIGGAFSSAASFGGGSETTVLSLLQTLLVHGMIVQGFCKGSHFGPVAAGAPDDRSRKECEQLGITVATLAQKIQNSI